MATFFIFLCVIGAPLAALTTSCEPFQRSPSETPCTKPKWSQQGITVAGDGTDGKSNTRIGHPFCVYLDQNDDLYVCDFGNHRIQKFTSNSTVATTLIGGLDAKNFYPNDLFFDANSNLFITDYFSQRILKLFPNSTDSKIINTKHAYPSSIYLDKEGNVFVLQLDDGGYGAPTRLVKYSTTTEEKTVYAAEFVNPSGLFVDGCGTAYVANSIGLNAGSVQKIVNPNDKKGIVLAGNLSQPTDVKLDPFGNVYYVERGQSRIQRINARDGKIETIVDKQGTLVFGVQYWNDPQFIAFDSQYNLYVSDYKNYRVQKFLFQGGDLFC